MVVTRQHFATKPPHIVPVRGATSLFCCATVCPRFELVLMLQQVKLLAVIHQRTASSSLGVYKY